MKSILTELARQEGSPMLSMIVSTEMNSFAGKKKVQLKLKNQIDYAAKELKLQYGEEAGRKLINATKSLAKKIDFNHLESGIGLYVSPKYQQLITFPFPVSDKVTLGSSFEISAIQETLDKMIQYAVVLVSKHAIRLFIGKGKKIKEVDNHDFPLYFEDQFQVQRTSPHSLYNSEESEIDQARLDAYFRKGERLLSTYIKDQPIVLMGTVKSLGNFEAIRKKKIRKIAELMGNFDKHKAHEILDLVWPEIESFTNK